MILSSGKVEITHHLNKHLKYELSFKFPYKLLAADVWQLSTTLCIF